jgi:hypothetical protein
MAIGQTQLTYGSVIRPNNYFLFHKIKSSR